MKSGASVPHLMLSGFTPRISLRSSGLQIPSKRTDVIVLLIDMSTLISAMRWARYLNSLAA
jgi:hypothetical protein